ncbi:MAG: head-tail connector protein [Planctomycetes bacterium]|nr:head-tail connector protein [Planctomycetota bacterium]
MGLVLLEAPSAPVVSLEEAQVHLRSEVAEESALIISLVAAATAQAEAFCRRRFVTQRWRATLDRFPDGALLLPHPPLASVDAVTYADTAGVAQVMAPADYVVRPAETPGEVIPAYGKSWPATRDVPDAVAVDFTCGYGDPADVPEAVKRAVLLLVGTLYANRESVAPTNMQPIPHTAEWLLGPFVVRRFAA